MRISIFSLLIVVFSICSVAARNGSHDNQHLLKRLENLEDYQKHDETRLSKLEDDFHAQSSLIEKQKKTIDHLEETVQKLTTNIEHAYRISRSNRRKFALIRGLLLNKDLKDGPFKNNDITKTGFAHKHNHKDNKPNQEHFHMHIQNHNKNTHHHSHQQNDNKNPGQRQHSHQKNLNTNTHQHSHHQNNKTRTQPHSHPQNLNKNNHQHSHQQNYNKNTRQQSHQQNRKMNTHPHSHQTNHKTNTHQHSHKPNHKANANKQTHKTNTTKSNERSHQQNHNHHRNQHNADKNQVHVHVKQHSSILPNAHDNQGYVGHIKGQILLGSKGNQNSHTQKQIQSKFPHGENRGHDNVHNKTNSQKVEPTIESKQQQKQDENSSDGDIHAKHYHTHSNELNEKDTSHHHNYQNENQVTRHMSSDESQRRHRSLKTPRQAFGGISFSVYLDHDATVAQHETVKFNKIITNDGGGYNEQTGVFTCSEEGVYMLTFSIGQRDQDHYMWAELMVNNKNMIDAVVDTYHPSQDLQGGNTVIVRLNSGDRVWIDATHNGSHVEGSGSLRLTTFSGLYLYS